jgi:hypothetical protein
VHRAVHELMRSNCQSLAQSGSCTCSNTEGKYAYACGSTVRFDTTGSVIPDVHGLQQRPCPLCLSQNIPVAFFSLAAQVQLLLMFIIDATFRRQAGRDRLASAWLHLIAWSIRTCLWLRHRAYAVGRSAQLRQSVLHRFHCRVGSCPNRSSLQVRRERVCASRRGDQRLV